MNKLYCIIAIVCASIVGQIGCTSSAPETETSNIAAPPQTTVIRYTADDIQALPEGEFLQVDLNEADTVYSVSYDNVSDLDRVLVTSGPSQYILGDRLPASTSRSSLKQIILGASSATDVANAIGGAETNEGVSCRCPCCIQIRNVLVCCL